MEQELKALLSRRTPGLMDSTRQYAVLVPLIREKEGYSLLYEVRAGTLRRQPGEVCFPGGRVEPGEDPTDCALREACEELALDPDRVEVLGDLDFIAHRANFILYPVLGLVDGSVLDTLRPSPAEVGEVFTVPLKHLLETEPLEYDYSLIPSTGAGFPYELLNIPRDYKWQPGRENVPVYPWEGKAIWGLTGRITRHLVALIRNKA